MVPAVTGAKRAYAPGRVLRRLPRPVAAIVTASALVVVGLGLLVSVLLTIFIGFFLALGFELVIAHLQRSGMRRGFAVLLGLLVGLLIGLAGFVVLALQPAISQLVGSAPDLIADIQDSQTALGGLLARPEVADAVQDFLGQAPGYLLGSLGTVFGVLGAAAAAIFTAFTVAALMVYFMLALPRMLALTERALGRPERTRVMREALGKVGGYVTGQLTICVCAGAVSYVFFLVVGMPYAAVLAIVVGVLDAIPQVGATLGAMVAIVVALTVGLGLAVTTLVFFLVYQQVENYLIAPRLFSRAVNLSPAAVFIAILIGAAIAGVVGALVALPVTAALKEVGRYLFRDQLAEIEGGQPEQDQPEGDEPERDEARAGQARGPCRSAAMTRRQHRATRSPSMIMKDRPS